MMKTFTSPVKNIALLLGTTLSFSSVCVNAATSSLDSSKVLGQLARMPFCRTMIDPSSEKGTVEKWKFEIAGKVFRAVEDDDRYQFPLGMYFFYAPLALFKAEVAVDLGSDARVRIPEKHRLLLATLPRDTSVTLNEDSSCAHISFNDDFLKYFKLITWNLFIIHRCMAFRNLWLIKRREESIPNVFMRTYGSIKNEWSFGPRSVKFSNTLLEQFVQTRVRDLIKSSDGILTSLESVNLDAGCVEFLVKAMTNCPFTLTEIGVDGLLHPVLAYSALVQLH